MPTLLGKTLLVVNPVAQNGKGIEAAARASVFLGEALGEGMLDVATTARPLHAVDLAANAEGYDTVVTLGGDGVIHEVANGLMKRPQDERPQLGVIPVGSGNDYARTLGMSCNIDRACAQLLAAKPRPADVGCVNGRFFVETLSFGLDAAIALDTVDRRARTGRTGTILYAEAGVEQLIHHLDARGYVASFDGGERHRGESITFAVQVGRTYGGGFVICPDARIDDGLLDLCIAHPPMNVAGAVFLFALAKGGHHTRFKKIEMLRARTLRVEFEEEPPAQLDGERIEGRAFDVSVVPHALEVLTA